jgi:molybdate transport repressor ModE-like protein
MAPFEDLSLLRLFVRIAESGSISGAARSMKVPQPTVSRHLRTLEDRAGTTLLLRDTHRTRLTDAGHRLLADAHTILELAEQAEQRLHEERAVLRGHLRVFATVDFGQHGVARLLSRFLTSHPEMTGELSYSNRPVQMIEAGFDVGVVAGDIADKQLVARKVGTIELAVVASPRVVERFGPPRKPRDLSRCRWVRLSQRQFGGGHDEVALQRPGRAVSTVKVRPVLLAEGVSALREAALADLGMAILPLWLIRRDLAEGALLRVLPTWSVAPIPLSAIYVRQRTTPVRVRALIDFVAVHAQHELDAPVGGDE